MKQDAELPNWKRVALIVYTIAMIIYCFATLSLSIKSWTVFSNAAASLDQTLTNFKSNFIDSLTVTSSGCPSGTNELYYWDFPGTIAGCNCSATTGYTPFVKQLYTSSCDSNQTKYGCKAISAAQAIRLARWQGSTIVCAKRSDKYNFINTLRNRDTETKCKSGFTACGSGVGLVCLPSGSTCPIYTISTTVPSGTYETAGTFGNGGKLYAVRTGTDHPIVEGRTAIDGVCLSDNRQINFAGSEYPLMKSSRGKCTTDTRFSAESVAYNEYDYYTSNAVISTIANTGGDIAPFVSRSRNWQLYSRKVLQWNFNCSDKIEPLEDKSKSVSGMKSVQLVLFIITIISSIVVGIIIPYMTIMNLCGKDLPCIDGKGEYERERLGTIKKYLDLGAKIIKIPFAIWAIALTTSTGNYFQDVQWCSDPLVNATFLQIQDLISSSYATNRTFLIITALLFVVEIIVVIVQHFRKKKIAADRDNDPKKDGNSSTFVHPMDDTITQPVQPAHPMQTPGYQMIPQQQPPPYGAPQPAYGAPPPAYGQPPPPAYGQPAPAYAPQPQYPPQQPRYSPQPAQPQNIQITLNAAPGPQPPRPGYPPQQYPPGFIPS